MLGRSTRSAAGRLADAQADGERSLRSSSARTTFELESHTDQSERRLALGDARRAVDLDSHTARELHLNEELDNVASERRERSKSISLVVQLAEEERIRRVGEFAHESLESRVEELNDRHASARLASDGAEAERARRLFSNPHGPSPFSLPNEHPVTPRTEEQLESEHRRAASLLADSAAQGERTRQVHERVDDDALNSVTEALERTLNQQHARDSRSPSRTTACRRSTTTRARRTSARRRSEESIS
jgi:hypothetical protein